MPVEYTDGPYLGLRCYVGELPDCPIEQKSGAWYIKLGFAGFNSRANNMMGYQNEAKALAAIRRYQAA